MLWKQLSFSSLNSTGVILVFLARSRLFLDFLARLFAKILARNSRLSRIFAKKTKTPSTGKKVFHLPKVFHIPKVFQNFLRNFCDIFFHILNFLSKKQKAKKLRHPHHFLFLRTELFWKIYLFKKSKTTTFEFFELNDKRRSCPFSAHYRC